MFGLSTELITEGKLVTVKRFEIRVLTFRALALCQSESRNGLFAVLR